MDVGNKLRELGICAADGTEGGKLNVDLCYGIMHEDSKWVWKIGHLLHFNIQKISIVESSCLSLFVDKSCFASGPCVREVV